MDNDNTAENPSDRRVPAIDDESPAPAPDLSSDSPSSHAAFTNLDQVDADLALARLIHQQERAFMALNGNYDGFDDWSYGDDEVGEEIVEIGLDSHRVVEERDGGSVEGSDYGDDEFDAIDVVEFEGDETNARSIRHDAARGLVAHMMALIGLLDSVPENLRSAEVNSQVSANDSEDAWQEIDPDNYTYEELVALGELIGTESKGLAADTVAALPVVNYKAENIEDGNADRCVICQLEYEEGNALIVLSCKHSYHPECINQWLQMNKVCPVCNTEVSTSDNQQDKIKD